MKRTTTTGSPRRPSLHDVAKMAGVSAAAVSYVVNGRTKEVGSGTLERIETAIKSLRYQPQRRGLSLKYNREFAIGLVIIDPDTSFLADPFTTYVAAGLSNALLEPGYGLTVTGCRNEADLDKFLRRSIGVDAFVVVASGSDDVRSRVYHRLHDADLPVVVIQEDAPDGIEDACAIMQDDFGGACRLARHLLGRGATRFLFVAPSRSWPAIQRREAGIRSVLPAGASLLRIECDEQDFTSTTVAIDRCLKGSLPDAIMGANDQIALAALRVLHDRGVAVPRDVQVTGYNDFSFRNYSVPLLTTITSSANAIGRRAAEAVLSRLETGAFEERLVQLPIDINVGGTTK